MSVQGIVYLVNRATKFITYAGEVPATYGNITGLSAVDYSVLRDLEASFPDENNSYKNLGFLTEEDALSLGVAKVDIDKMKAGAWEMKWSSLEQERSDLIQDQRWRIDRHNDEIALGRTPTEDIKPVLDYCQAIRDLPKTNPDPYNIVWPTIPA